MVGAADDIPKDEPQCDLIKVVVAKFMLVWNTEHERERKRTN